MTDLIRKISLLEQEVARLTDERRFAMTTLETAANLLTFHSGPIEMTDQEQTLAETASKIFSILSFEGICFYLINEEDASFSPAYCEPAEYQPEFEAIVDQLIEDQTFAWALSRNREVRVEIKNPPRTLLLHSLATASRTRGMFVGLPLNFDEEFESPLPLLTVILHSCANILESFAIYHRMREINHNLELSVSELQQRSKDLLLSRETSQKSEQGKNVIIATLKKMIEQEVYQLSLEAEQLVNTNLNSGQEEYANKLKKRISQILDEVDRTTAPLDYDPINE